MPKHILTLTRVLDAPRANVWRCWTEPDLLVQWFTPKPWSTVRAELDVRAGGSSLVVMRSPDGVERPNPGVYLEVLPFEKIVVTDAYTSAWVPSEKPFMTATMTFADTRAGTTSYTATVAHWSAADCDTHERMGFHAGWGKAADQLEELARGLARRT